MVRPRQKTGQRRKGDEKPVHIGPKEAAAAAEVLKALGNPMRLRIACCLTEGKTHVTAIAEKLDIRPAVISQQLRILRSVGLVAAVTESGRAYYHIIEPHLYDMLTCVDECVTDRAKRGKI